MIPMEPAKLVSMVRPFFEEPVYKEKSIEEVSATVEEEPEEIAEETKEEPVEEDLSVITSPLVL